METKEHTYKISYGGGVFLRFIALVLSNTMAGHGESLTVPEFMGVKCSRCPFYRIKCSGFEEGVFGSYARLSLGIPSAPEPDQLNDASTLVCSDPLDIAIGAHIRVAPCHRVLGKLEGFRMEPLPDNNYEKGQRLPKLAEQFTNHFLSFAGNLLDFN